MPATETIFARTTQIVSIVLAAFGSIAGEFTPPAGGPLLYGVLQLVLGALLLWFAMRPDLVATVAKLRNVISGVAVGLIAAVAYAIIRHTRVIEVDCGYLRGSTVTAGLWRREGMADAPIEHLLCGVDSASIIWPSEAILATQAVLAGLYLLAFFLLLGTVLTLLEGYRLRRR
jgi:hypothetical protein